MIANNPSFVFWYQFMADALAMAQDRGSTSRSHLVAALDVLDESDIPSADIDRQYLESAITESKIVINNNHVLYSPQLIAYMYKLQKFIDDDYGDLNSFLYDNSILVKQTFADISSAVGYQIDEGNIEQIS